MPKKTPWFDGSVKPVRNGPYETNIAGGGSHGFNYWIDGRWGICSRSPEDASSDIGKGTPSYVQNIRWRGLTEEAK